MPNVQVFMNWYQKFPAPIFVSIRTSHARTPPPFSASPVLQVDGPVLLGSNPSVVVMPDGDVLILPLGGTTVNHIFRIGGQYVLATREGQFHTIGVADLQRCPACTFQTADPLALLQSASTLRHPRRLREARTLSLRGWLPPQLRPWPVRRNDTARHSGATGARAARSARPGPGDRLLMEVRDAGAPVMHALHPALETGPLAAESVTEWYIGGAGPPLRWNGTSNGTGAAAPLDIVGPGPEAAGARARNGTGPPGVAAAHALGAGPQWPPGGVGGRSKGRRAMVPEAVVAPEITACAEARGLLFCAFSGTAERVIRSIDRSTWVPSPDGLNVTGLMDVVNLLQVCGAPSGPECGLAADKIRPEPTIAKWSTEMAAG